MNVKDRITSAIKTLSQPVINISVFQDEFSCLSYCTKPKCIRINIITYFYGLQQLSLMLSSQPGGDAGYPGYSEPFSCFRLSENK